MPKARLVMFVIGSAGAILGALNVLWARRGIHVVETRGFTGARRELAYGRLWRGVIEVVVSVAVVVTAVTVGATGRSIGLASAFVAVAGTEWLAQRRARAAIVGGWEHGVDHEARGDEGRPRPIRGRVARPGRD